MKRTIVDVPHGPFKLWEHVMFRTIHGRRIKCRIVAIMYDGVVRVTFTTKDSHPYKKGQTIQTPSTWIAKR